jgi:hypothetical protein
MLRIIIGASVTIVAVAAVVLIWSHWRWNESIEADIRRLSAGAVRDIVVVTEDMLAALPAPARRYLTYSGVVGKPIPNTVRLTQRGRIRSAADAAWMNLAATQHYSTEPPAFVWKASFPTRNLPVVLGRDEYLDGQGSIRMKMLSLYPVADESGGAEMNEASLMRYLNEMMWFPAAFLGDNVTWTPIDDASAKVTIDDRGINATATLFFDAEGRLVNFRAPRFNTATRTMETWETPIAGHGEFAGLKLPSKGSAVWKLSDGDFTYIELEIVEVAYDGGQD